eukprot:gene41988-51258_t
MTSNLYEASDEQLQGVISQALLSCPFTSASSEQSSPQDRLADTISTMRSKGLRPITVTEYRQGLEKATSSSSRFIGLWKPLDDTSPYPLRVQVPQDGGAAYEAEEGAASLPFDSAAALSTLGSLEGAACGVVDTQAETVEWATLQHD